MWAYMYANVTFKECKTEKSQKVQIKFWAAKQRNVVDLKDSDDGI
jgi:hypothetical protein